MKVNDEDVFRLKQLIDYLHYYDRRFDPRVKMAKKEMIEIIKRL
jgi:hypothetical protein